MEMSLNLRIYKSVPLELLQKRWPNIRSDSSDLTHYVSGIIQDVKERGDQAVLDYTRRFDGVNFETTDILVSKQEIKDAYNFVTNQQIKALREAKQRLENLELKRLNAIQFEYTLDEVLINVIARPIQTVGCYVPGGKAAYPSSVIMNLVPAMIAGVPKIIVASPPQKDGKINPLTLVAADICGVNTIYKMGGVQAIAALAYGTKTINKVEKIVGPGNTYVTEAKTQVSRDVAIDSPAGPSEIIIIADDTSDPKLVALDLIAQAEHGPRGICGLITTSKSLASKVNHSINKIIKNAPRKQIILDILNEGGFIFVCTSLTEAVEFVNEFAPEHLEILTAEPELVLNDVINAGIVLLGPYTPVAASDYSLGTNHVLPTEGYGKVYSGLTVLNFIKILNVAQCTREGLEKLQSNIVTLATAEGLLNHAKSVEVRFNK
jgi:histidinol dehydrogenase